MRVVWTVSLLGFDDHTGFQWFYAGTGVGLTVHHHDAIGAATNRTKHTARFITPSRVTVNQHIVAPQGNGDGLTFEAFHGPAVKSKFDRLSLVKCSQNRVVFDAHDKRPYRSRLMGSRVKVG